MAAKQRPMTSAAGEVGHGGKNGASRKSMDAGMALTFAGRHRGLKSSGTRPLSRTNHSQSHRNFKNLKQYVNKGLTDILDRD